MGHDDSSLQVVVVEFSDFQCSYCAAFASDVLPELREAYLDPRTTPISQTAQTIEPGRPMPLFRPPIHGGGTDVNLGAQYEVSRDGRFLINVVLEDAAATPITLIENWQGR